MTAEIENIRVIPSTVSPTVLSVAHKRYVLFVLTLVYTLNYLDRNLVALLLEPIKRDLALSDSELGFLTGIAFGLFYAVLGIPIARWADRGDRVNITSIAIGLWGATVMICIFVTNFFQLVLARVAAAVGEAGCMPPTYSLVGDYFPAPAERTAAMATYMLAGPVASLIGFTLGGWLNDHYGWRVTFFLLGIPGLLVAVLVKATIADTRTHAISQHTCQVLQPSMLDVLRCLSGQTSLRHLSTAIVLLYTFGLGLSPWYAAFMVRSHGMGTSDLGIWLGLVFGISGVVGVALGGYLATRRFATSERRQMRWNALAVASLAPCHLLFLLLAEKHVVLIALIPVVAVFNFVLGPTFALLQRLVADEMRATTLSVVMLMANLIGMGLGPQVVGVISDFLAPHLGGDSLRYAMLIVSLVSLWSAYHFWQAGRTVEEDLSAMPSREQFQLTK